MKVKGKLCVSDCQSNCLLQNSKDLKMYVDERGRKERKDERKNMRERRKEIKKNLFEEAD